MGSTEFNRRLSKRSGHARSLFETGNGTTSSTAPSRPLISGGLALYPHTHTNTPSSYPLPKHITLYGGRPPGPNSIFSVARRSDRFIADTPPRPHYSLRSTTLLPDHMPSAFGHRIPPKPYGVRVVLAHATLPTSSSIVPSSRRRGL